MPFEYRLEFNTYIWINDTKIGSISGQSWDASDPVLVRSSMLNKLKEIVAPASNNQFLFTNGSPYIKIFVKNLDNNDTVVITQAGMTKDDLMQAAADEVDFWKRYGLDLSFRTTILDGQQVFIESFYKFLPNG